jgi:hypothetical protein
MYLPGDPAPPTNRQPLPVEAGGTGGTTQAVAMYNLGITQAIAHASANLTGTAPDLTAGNVLVNANLTGPITSIGNATTITSGNTYTNPTLSGIVSGTPSWASTQSLNTSGNAATVTTNANLTGPIISSGNATSVASQTGTGSKFVMDTSPALAGTPTAPTAGANNNSTQIATTAYVDAAVVGTPPTVAISLFKRGALAMAQNQTFYGQCVGKAADGTESNGEAYVLEPMTLSELRAVSSAAVPAANTVVFTVRKNGADTSLTCTIGAGATSASDITHSVDFGQSDRFSIKIVASATAGTNDYKATVRAVNIGLTTGLPTLQFSGAGDGGGGITVSEANGGTGSLIQSDVPIPKCLVSYPVFPVAGSTQPFGINRNGTALPLATAWFIESTGATAAQLADSARLAFADMDLLDIVATAGTTGFINTLVKLKTSSGSYDPCPLLFSSRNQAQNTTLFSGGFGGNGISNATENKVQIAMPACTVKKLRASTDTTPAAGQTVTLTLRKNGVDQSLTCQITNGGGRSASDLSNTVTFTAGDLLSIKFVSSATVGTRSTNCSVEVIV